MQIANKFALLIAVTLLAPQSYAADSESRAAEKLDEAIIEKFHFDDYILKSLGVAHVKGKMASMEDAYCLQDGNEKGTWRLILLQTNTLEPDIKGVIAKSALPNSLRVWARKTELAGLSIKEKQELVALPSNDALDRVIASWLWSRFDAYDGDAQLRGLAKQTWDAICIKRKKLK